MISVTCWIALQLLHRLASSVSFCLLSPFPLLPVASQPNPLAFPKRKKALSQNSHEKSQKDLAIKQKKEKIEINAREQSSKDIIIFWQISTDKGWVLMNSKDMYHLSKNIFTSQLLNV